MTDTLAPADVATGPPPARRGPIGSVVAGWRQLTSMRTALVLLFLLALAAVPGSLLPQRGLNAGAVTKFYADHPTLAPLLDRLSGFDVFAAPWFAAIYLALFVSLAGCVLPRLWRQLRTVGAAPPVAPRYLGRLPVTAAWATDRDAPAVARAARRRLRGWRVAVRTEPDGAVTVAAERGLLKELGNLLFHLALLVLLAGVALGGLFGYKGNVLVVEGDGFSNTLAGYDSFSPGRLFTPRELSPYTFVLDRFSATYQPSGEPATFGAQIRYAPTPGAAMRRYDVRVNAPLSVGGTKLYLIGHGYAPRFVVRGPAGKVVFGDPVHGTPVPFLPRDNTFASDGVVKVPDIAPAKDGTPRQLAFAGFFTPTTAYSPAGIVSSYPAPRNPAVTLVAYLGDLGLDSGRPQSVYTLDPARLHQVVAGNRLPVTKTLQVGQTMTLPKGAGSITFTGYDQFATFQITHDPGRQLALGAAALLLVGLVLSLRGRRRRLWLRARADGSRTVVEAGGLARNDTDGFADEFSRLVPRLQEE